MPIWGAKYSHEEAAHISETAAFEQIITDNTNAILNERYKEFIGEGKRWWDLRRAGDSYVIDNVPFLTSGEEFQLLLPITQDMIGRNPLLKQTSGYTN